MNKKFSTLMASFLLAGGLFSTVNAAIQDMIPGQYYRMAVGATDHNQNSYFLDSDGANWYVKAAALDKDGSSWWRVEKVKDPITEEVIAYKLVNKKGVYYTVKDENGKAYTAFKAQNSSQKVTIKADNTLESSAQRSEYWGLVPYGTSLTAHEGSAVADIKWGFDNVKITPISITETEANKILGNGFGLKICKHIIKTNGAIDDKKDPAEYTDLQGNPFTGVLTAKALGDDASTFALYQANGKRIVLTSSTWGSQAGGTTQEGYKFAVMNDKEYKAAVEAKTIKADEFSIAYPATVAGAPLEVSMIIENEKDDEAAENKYELVVTIIEDVARLTVAPSLDENGEAVADYTYDPTATVKNNTYVCFGLSNLTNYAQFADQLLNITRVPVEGGAVEAAAPACDDEDGFVPVAQVALDQPEGEWLLSNLEGAFINRESGNVVVLSALRDTDTEDVYTDGKYNYTITAVGAPGETEDGYFAVYTADELKQKSFFIGTPIVSTGDTVYMTNTGAKISWTTDKSEAIAFRFSKVIFGADPKKEVIKHVTNYLGEKDDKLVVKSDIINFYRYNLAEVATGKVLGYDADNQVFALGKANVEEANTAWNEYTVVLKSKGAESYNILTEIDGDVLEVKTVSNVKNWYTKDHAFCAAEKLYGAHNSNSLVKSQSAYKYVENDIFVITDADANMYRPVVAMDTIKIFRNADNNYVLYEQGTLLKENDEVVAGFLGVENFLDPKFAEKNPALLVDTAAGYNTWRPEYMLALNATVVPEGKWCDFDQSADCPHAVPTRGYATGRYLVNLVDSAANRKDCKYQDFNGTTYYRLGFVQAKHIGDSLIIASTSDTINLVGNTVDKVCTFAFRYIDANRDAFRIETAYKVNYDSDGDVKSTDRGWIKYHNGIPVVTPHVSDAEVFDLESLQGVEPTANEAIDAEAGVQVIGGQGVVTVQGAAGKVITVANILGQTIANQVAASDNVTIAAPAGVVVVAVEGEATKVVVK